MHLLFFAAESYETGYVWCEGMINGYIHLHTMQTGAYPTQWVPIPSEAKLPFGFSISRVSWQLNCQEPVTR